MTIDMAMQSLAVVFALIAAVLSYYNRTQIKNIHHIMNSRLDQLLMISATAAEARGFKMGREEGNKENKS